MASTLDPAAIDVSPHSVPTQNPKQTSNRFGALTLPISALTFAILTPPLVEALAQLLRNDAESRAARALAPLWEDLVVAGSPDKNGTVSLFERLFDNSKVRSRRLRSEISDALSTISRYAEPLPVEIDEMIELNVGDDDQEEVRVAVEILLAAKYLTEVGGLENAQEPRSATREAMDIDSLARVWEQARNFAGSERCRRAT